MESQRLPNDNVHVKEENHKFMERCKKLEDSRAVAENILNALNFFSQASLRDGDAKVE